MKSKSKERILCVLLGKKDIKVMMALPPQKKERTKREKNII